MFDDAENTADSGAGEPVAQNRVSTGVRGLDPLMQGGFVENSIVLATGKTGTGKSTLAASFIWQGVQEGEPGVYVTTEERKEDLQKDIAAMFGWDFARVEEQGKARILSIKPIFPTQEVDNLNRLVRSYISDLISQILDAIQELDAERVVIDSVSLIEMFIQDEYLSRVALSSLVDHLKDQGVTAVLTGTIPETSEGLSGGGIIEFIVDTVIKLDFVPVAEEHKRTLNIRKMRRTDHSTLIHPFTVADDGLQIVDIE